MVHLKIDADVPLSAASSFLITEVVKSTARTLFENGFFSVTWLGREFFFSGMGITSLLGSLIAAVSRIAMDLFDQLIEEKADPKGAVYTLYHHTITKTCVNASTTITCAWLFSLIFGLPGGLLTASLTIGTSAFFSNKIGPLIKPYFLPIWSKTPPPQEEPSTTEEELSSTKSPEETPSPSSKKEPPNNLPPQPLSKQEQTQWDQLIQITKKLIEEINYARRLYRLKPASTPLKHHNQYRSIPAQAESDSSGPPLSQIVKKQHPNASDLKQLDSKIKKLFLLLSPESSVRKKIAQFVESFINVSTDKPATDEPESKTESTEESNQNDQKSLTGEDLKNWNRLKALTTNLIQEVSKGEQRGLRSLRRPEGTPLNHHYQYHQASRKMESPSLSHLYETKKPTTEDLGHLRTKLETVFDTLSPSSKARKNVTKFAKKKLSSPEK